MASSEDELAKKQIQEAIWTWAGRIVALAAIFLLGFVSAFWLWGYGPNGAGQLREQVVVLEGQTRDLNKKRIDCEGKLTVTETRLGQALGDLQKARAAAPAPPATP